MRRSKSGRKKNLDKVLRLDRTVLVSGEFIKPVNPDMPEWVRKSGGMFVFPSRRRRSKHSASKS